LHSRHTEHDPSVEAALHSASEQCQTAAKNG